MNTLTAAHRGAGVRGLILSLAFVLCAVPECQQRAADPQPGGAPMSLHVTSTAFKEGETIPKQYTGDGADQSPPLRWSDPPDGTKSFALLCEDPDAPRGTFVHWVLFNVSADVRELPEGVPARETLADGAKQGKNGFGKIGFGGPAPPKGKPHRYYFKLYALDTTPDLSAGATAEQVRSAVAGHVLAEGQLMGRYQR
jgi:Raf kinase inhibitor-like YbhB/YbcL family protein